MTWQQEGLDYLEAGLRLIPLHSMVNGKCGCESQYGEACEAVGKHPMKTDWQKQSLIDSAILENWSNFYSCSGLGFALDNDHIIVDVDQRSGGLESLKQLQIDIKIDLFEVCTAIVKTGGGGYHFYFRKLDSAILGWKMPAQYKGIDIKQAGGFVVTAGSMHKSGSEYEWHSAAKSDLQSLAVLPEAIAEMLARAKQAHREEMKSSGLGDVTEIAEMLEYIKNDGDGLEFDMWLRIGMSIHHATNGGNDGLTVFRNWSSQSAKFDANDLDRRWHSFGKRSANVATSGSLVYIARQAGWEPGLDSNALSQTELDEIKASWDKKHSERISLPSIADDADIDLHSPPGLLGRINDYVYECSVFPNRNLALACSLSILTNAIGRKYYLPGRFSNIQPNLLVLCIAGSSVGKDSVLGAAHRLLSSIGMGPAIHGRIKSDKDLLDALENNQFAVYFNDEFGYFLQRLNNAAKKGTASYLEGIIGTIMEVFTKGDKTVLVDISRKKEIRERYLQIIGTLAKALDAGDFKDKTSAERKLARAKFLLDKFKDGIPNPWLSMFTTATPRTMELAFSGEATENGFLSRALTFHEYETNPRPKEGFKGALAVPMGLQMAMRGVAFEKDECAFGRIDSFEQDQTPITIDQDASVFVDRAIEYFFELAETQKAYGLESLPRRALDSIIKVCIAMSAEEKRLTLDIARYAVKLVRKEMDGKIRRVNSTENMGSRDAKERLDGVASRILEVCNTAGGETPAVIHRQVKNSKVTQDIIHQVLENLTDGGMLERIDTGRSYANAKLFRYKTTTKGGA